MAGVYALHYLKGLQVYITTLRIIVIIHVSSSFFNKRKFIMFIQDILQKLVSNPQQGIIHEYTNDKHIYQSSIHFDLMPEFSFTIKNTIFTNLFKDYTENKLTELGAHGVLCKLHYQINLLQMLPVLWSDIRVINSVIPNELSIVDFQQLYVLQQYLIKVLLMHKQDPTKPIDLIGFLTDSYRCKQ